MAAPFQTQPHCAAGVGGRSRVFDRHPCQPVQLSIPVVALPAQEGLNGRLADVWRQHPEARPIVRLALAAVGRGGSGDLGQRIRDDILSIQSANGAKVTDA